MPAIGAALVLRAHRAGERDDGADVGAAGGQARHLGADLEILALHAHAHRQPPVTGGKKAISRAPAMLAVGWTCV